MVRPSAMTSVLLVVAAATVAQAAPALTADDKAKLMAGEIVVRVNEDPRGEADAAVEAAIDIAAPPLRVWAVMTDCARAPTYVEGLISCRVIERSADGLNDVREHRTRTLALLPQTVSVFRSAYLPPREIRFERVGGDLKYLKGAWNLEPRKGGAATRLLYEVRISAGVSAPGFMIRGALEQSLTKVLAALRREVVSGK